ncbi:hypothetical protein [Burkholderia sp. USMB20]|uniref:hypothetical protein n=1 Tax=Burkholderia sp. USMB20 TaxID=1571773 RepID=UPI001F2FD95E|nr:hypothetical protein [Burkholderia sp. USMB20]
MPPLPLLGALLDTAGTALKAVRDAGSSAAAGKTAGNDAATSPAAVPFAQTLKQSVGTRHDAANAGKPDATTKQCRQAAAGTKPSGTGEQPTTTRTDAQSDAAALAAAAAVQASCWLARRRGAGRCRQHRHCRQTRPVGPTAQPRDNHAQGCGADRLPPRGPDALQTALAKLTGRARSDAATGARGRGGRSARPQRRRGLGAPR